MTEHEHQVTLMKWAALQSKALPDLELLFAVPNGGHRHPATGAKLKAEGVKPGVPDLFLPVPRHGFHGLWLELKTELKASKVSAVQEWWLMALSNQGYKTVVCKGWDSARNEILEYLK